MNVVIGGGSGIGQEVAEVLSGRTVVADRNGTEIKCDLTDASSLASLARDVDELDALVVTAGVSPAMTDARTIFDVDLAGVARVLDAFDDLVRPGVVAVCVASMAGHLGSWTDETLQALDEPLSCMDAGLTDDPATAYILATWAISSGSSDGVYWGPEAPVSCLCRPVWLILRWGALNSPTPRARPQLWMVSAGSGG